MDTCTYSALSACRDLPHSSPDAAGAQASRARASAHPTQIRLPSALRPEPPSSRAGVCQAAAEFCTVA